VERYILVEGMQDTSRRLRVPVTMLELVALMAGVNYIGKIVRATLRHWLKVILGEFRPYVSFRDTTVATPKGVQLP
jgi:hypothetical protein